jgi:hypothetical protein
VLGTNAAASAADLSPDDPHPSEAVADAAALHPAAASRAPSLAIRRPEARPAAVLRWDEEVPFRCGLRRGDRDQPDQEARQEAAAAFGH